MFVKSMTSKCRINSVFSWGCNKYEPRIPSTSCINTVTESEISCGNAKLARKLALTCTIYITYLYSPLSDSHKIAISAESRSSVPDNAIS